MTRQYSPRARVCALNGMKEKLILCLCTVPDEATGRKIAHALVDSGLAACVNRLPGVASVYRWEGRIEEDAEELLLIKTRADRLSDLVDAVVREHPSELPEVLTVPVTGGLEGYLEWVAVSSRGAATNE